MTTRGERPLPHPTTVSRPFWDACRERRLTCQRCEDCEGYVFPPQDFCRHCFGGNLSWVDVSGEATVYSYTVVWRPQVPAFEVPYVVAILDMAEGYQMLSNLVDCTPEQVAIGMPVALAWEDASEEITLPKFRPATA